MSTELIKLGLCPDLTTQLSTADQVKRLIVKKTTIEVTQSWLKTLGFEGQVYEARAFLTAFLIAFYPREVLDNQFVPIYFLAKGVIRAYFQPELKDWLTQYFIHYRQWERTDRQRLINDLLGQYFDLDQTLIDVKPDDESTRQHLLGTQSDVLKRLQLFRAESQIADWRQRVTSPRALVYQIKAENLTGFEYYGEPTDIIGKQAFWDYFRECLQQCEHLASTLNHRSATEVESVLGVIKTHQNQIYATLNHFKQQLKDLTPKTPKLWAYYDEHLDMEYLEQLLNSQQFRQENLDQLVRFSYEQLRYLDSDHGTKQIDQWLANWDIIYQCPYQVSEVLPDILRDLLNKTEHLTAMFKVYRGLKPEDLPTGAPM